MSTKKIISITTGLAFVASAILAVPAFAQTSDANAQSNNGLHIGASLQGQARVGGYSGAGRGQGMMARLGVFGKVTAISGNTITISGRQGFGTTTAAISYAIDATNASVKKNNATSTISSIAVGDMVFAQGTVTGTNVVATTISDGALGRMGNRGQGNVGNKGMKNGGPEIASSMTACLGTGLGSSGFL